MTDEITTPTVAYSRELLSSSLAFKRGDQVRIDGITAKVVDVRPLSDDGRNVEVVLATPDYLAGRARAGHEASGCST
ncbi:hypothetical protein [Nonomuraea sp. NPDC023979]|uniref:hypothetical protein n=1 Tax=Nonomuraea sp. NPDC023979 TaxID=3154796 RepID=UPI0033D1B878